MATEDHVHGRRETDGARLRGQAHYPGYYWSATSGGHVIYESRLEFGRLLLTAYGHLFARDVRPALETLAQSRNQSTSHAP